MAEKTKWAVEVSYEDGHVDVIECDSRFASWELARWFNTYEFPLPVKKAKSVKYSDELTSRDWIDVVRKDIKDDYYDRVEVLLLKAEIDRWLKKSRPGVGVTS